MITCSFQNVLWSPDLSRMFYGHLTFPECSMVTWPFQNVLWSPDLITWLWLTQSLSCLLLRCILECLKCVGNLFPTRGSHNTSSHIFWCLCSCILYTPQMSQLPTWLSILSALILYFLEVFLVHHYVPVPFSIGSVPTFSFTMPFVG